MIPFLSSIPGMEEFLRLPEFCSLRFLLKAEGSRLPVDPPHRCLWFLPFISWWAAPCSSRLHSLCLPGVATEKPPTLAGDNLQKKTNSRSSQQAGETAPILLVPGFKVQ